MEMINLLKVSRETRKTIKEQAIRLHNKGKNESEIADALNISYQAVSRIIRAYHDSIIVLNSARSLLYSFKVWLFVKCWGKQDSQRVKCERGSYGNCGNQRQCA